MYIQMKTFLKVFISSSILKRLILSEHPDYKLNPFKSTKYSSLITVNFNDISD